MGIGKSAQSIRAADLINARKILVVCRAVARFNWRNEFETHSFRKRPITITEGLSAIGSPPDLSVTICSYEGMGCVLDALGVGAPFDLVIIDEAHFVKSPDADRSAKVFGKEGLVRKTKRMWLLTGTPTPNGYASELWLALYTFGACRYLLPDFIKFFCTTLTTGYGQRVTGTRTDKNAIDSFKKMTENVLLRRELKDTNLNLPDVIYETVLVPPGQVNIADHADFYGYSLNDDLRKLFNDKIEKEYAILEGLLADGKISDDLLSVIEASAKSIATLRRFNGLKKVDAVIELLKGELKSDKNMKVVVFAMHRSCIKAIAEGLAEFGSVTIWGGSKPSTVEKQIMKFQTVGSGTRVFVGQIVAAGTSINLTAANEVVIVEKDYVPGNNDQAIKRCARIGQKRIVRARFITLDDPIERRVDELVIKKTEEIGILLSNAKINELI